MENSPLPFQFGIDLTNRRLRFGIGQLMVAIAIIAFAFAIVLPLLNDYRVSLPTALAAHVAGLMIGIGVFLLALNEKQRRMLESAGGVLWRVRINVRDRPPRQLIDSFAVGVAMLIGFAAMVEVFQLSALWDIHSNSQPNAGVGGLSAGILISFAATQRRFPPSKLLICNQGVQFGFYFVAWSGLAFDGNTKVNPPVLVLKLPAWTCDLLPPTDIAVEVAAFLQQRCQSWPTGLE